jgi:hypothetical protein
MMRVALILAGLMLTSSAVHSGEPDSEPLDAAFLEYLGALEANDDNWTLLAEPAGKPAAPSATQSDSKAQPEPAKSHKPSKEAAKPAAEER